MPGELFPRNPMKLSHVLRTIPIAALAGVLLLPAAGASGSASQVTIMQDEAQLLFTSSGHRASTLDEMRGLGADVIKVRVQWRFIAPSPDAKKKPQGFSGENPGDYPSANWAPYDDLIRQIVARGMRPYLMLTGPAPRWASGKTGIDRPKPSQFKRFVQAVGTRYSGTFGTSPLDPLADPPPRVDIFAPWNEPNLYSWLTPQSAHGVPVSPKIYRRLVLAAQKGLQASGHGGDELLIGELLPYAHQNSANKRKFSPITFLRELACVNSHYHAYTGKAAKRRGCQHYKALPGTGLAYHPYTLAGGPDVRTADPNDASIADLDRVTNALDKLSHRGRLKSSRMPVWVSEFGFQTNPPDHYASAIKRVPGFMGQSEWLAYRNPRVASYAQYPLVDDAIDKSGSGFQSGLRRRNGKKKPGVYKAFQLPLFVEKRTAKVVEIFGGVRAGGAGDKVTIESRVGHKGNFKTLGKVGLGSQGYFDRVFTISKADERQYRFRLSGGGKSRTATAHG
ncbi:MAG: hypothetical protein QOG86_1503 [Thermoleophilaceae bacterium]|nr:hypothetical protein [Thermoleophilaceae bacterium]